MYNLVYSFLKINYILRLKRSYKKLSTTSIIGTNRAILSLGRNHDHGIESGLHWRETRMSYGPMYWFWLMSWCKICKLQLTALIDRKKDVNQTAASFSPCNCNTYNILTRDVFSPHDTCNFLTRDIFSPHDTYGFVTRDAFLSHGVFT